MSKPLAVSNRIDCAPARTNVASFVTLVAAPSAGAKDPHAEALPSVSSLGSAATNCIPSYQVVNPAPQVSW